MKIRTKDNKEFSVSRRLKKLDKPVQIFEFKVLDDNMGYLKINRFWGDRFKSEFDSLYHEIRKTSKLIIDIFIFCSVMFSFPKHRFSRIVPRNR